MEFFLGSVTLLFDNFAVTYELNAYCNEPARIYELYADLHRNILDVFKESGVEIMTPNYLAFPAEISPIAKDAVAKRARG